MAASQAGHGASSSLWKKSGGNGEWHLVQESVCPFMSFSNHARSADVIVQGALLTVKRRDDVADEKGRASAEQFGKIPAKGAAVGDAFSIGHHHLQLQSHLAGRGAVLAHK